MVAQVSDGAGVVVSEEGVPLHAAVSSPRATAFPKRNFLKIILSFNLVTANPIDIYYNTLH
jgi:hypothetical protein